MVIRVQRLVVIIGLCYLAGAHALRGAPPAEPVAIFFDPATGDVRVQDQPSEEPPSEEPAAAVAGGGVGGGGGDAAGGGGGGGGGSREGEGQEGGEEGGEGEEEGWREGPQLYHLAQGEALVVGFDVAGNAKARVLARDNALAKARERGADTATTAGQLHAQHILMDSDGDGFVTHAEFAKVAAFAFDAVAAPSAAAAAVAAAAAARASGGGGGSDEAALLEDSLRVLHACDADGDRRLSAAEMKSITPDQLPPRLAGMTQELFGRQEL
jgi:hypothetical protein